MIVNDIDMKIVRCISFNFLTWQESGTVNLKSVVTPGKISGAVTVMENKRKEST